MTCTHCDRCPHPIVVPPLAFRRLAERINSLAQRLELSLDAGDSMATRRAVAGLGALLADLHLCRVGDCVCPGRAQQGPGQILEVKA